MFGDLTGYLAKHHYNSYGGYWNNLAKQSQAFIEKLIRARLESSLVQADLPADILQPKAQPQKRPRRQAEQSARSHGRLHQYNFGSGRADW